MIVPVYLLHIANVKVDESSCSKVCDQHCIQIQTENNVKCACNRGYYLASDGITCIGKS